VDRRDLLDALAAGADRQTLETRFGDALDPTLATLREAGFVFDADLAVERVPEYGGPAVEYGLAAPYRVEYHDEVGSTNDRARELAADGRRDVVVLADAQTGGRGRRGREWAGPPGGVYLSVVVGDPAGKRPLVTFAAAVAVADAAREAGVPAGIKWPNDVLVGVRAGRAVGDADSGAERKLAGVLTERVEEAAVVGVGVNADVDATTLPAGATSLRSLGVAVDRRRFVQRLLERFDDLVGDDAATLEAWRERARTPGREVRVETHGGVLAGLARGVDETGALLVDTDDGRSRVTAGDCEHLRPRN
jgi:BirA family biotin operon repressor/biotin-[acetyl-CoA-carboxylase] ligase